MNTKQIINTIVTLTILLTVIVPFAIQSSLAVPKEEHLKNPELENRARNISKKIRCLVCQNQSIDESDAPTAKDLRLLIREKLKNGESDSQIIGYIQSRYGDFILLSPPVSPTTWALWTAPFIIFIIALIAILIQYTSPKHHKRKSNSSS